MASVMESRRRILLNTPHIETASGGVANFKTDMKAPLKGCKVNFLPKQSGSGDPSPTNIRPISGWDGVTVVRCGKNLFSGTERDTLYPVHIPVGTKVAASVKGINSGVRYYDKDRVRIDYWTLSYTPSFDSSRRYNTFTIINRDCEYFEFYGGTSPTDMQVEIIPQTSSLPTPYEPHTASTFPISWAQQGTFYGGYVDLVSGELVAEWAKRKMLDINWTYNSSSDRFDSPYMTGDAKDAVAGELNILCNRYKGVKNKSGGSYSNFEIGFNASNVGRPYIIIKDNRFTDKNSFVASLTDSDEIVYRIATPQIITTLTPQQIKTLKGINNVYSDADSAEVKFWTH